MFDVSFDGVFDELLAKMQGEDQRIRVQAAFHVTPEELGEAARALFEAAKVHQIRLKGAVDDV